MKLNFSDIHNWSTEKISQRILYALVALTVIVFGCFYFIGYDTPYDEDPNFNAPIFTNAIIVLMTTLTFCAIVIAVGAVYWGLQKRGKSDKLDNNIPIKKISYTISIGGAIMMILSFILGSGSVMTINGKEYVDTFWLKTADMFIFTGIALIIIAIAAVIFGATRYNRK